MKFQQKWEHLLSQLEAIVVDEWQEFLQSVRKNLAANQASSTQ
jgi:hypothetical protein